MSSNKAWVTLATNDSYSLGALVLAHSLKTAQTVHKLAILITPGVTQSMKNQIEAVFDDVKVVDVLDSKDQTHLALMSRPELGVTFTKLHCWTFTKYEKCVFLDADTLVLQNCDELFEREELSAAPDPGWPDCFNSGVFVYKPSQDTFAELLEFARTRGSFDGGDQGLLNMFFKDWSYKDISKHLSFTYNVVWSSTYSYLPALKQFGKNMKIIHFIASSKPWLQSFNTETRLVTATSGGSGLQALLQFWWDLFCRHVHPGLSTEMIESRLSSCYSNDLHPETPSHNISFYYTPNNNISRNYHTPTCEPSVMNNYIFIDPWDKYLNSNEQKTYGSDHKKIVDMHQVENVKGDINMVKAVCFDNNCEQEVETNCYINGGNTEEKTKDYSFQNYVIEDCNSFANEKKNNECFEEIREYNTSKQEQEPKNYENFPACSDYNPINLNSNLIVNNCRPDSPTHCEVSKDQPCDLDGGLAGQFARVSLGEKNTDQKALEDFLRRQSWEQGNMDYLGRDSFSNIWSKINETLGQTVEVITESDVVKTSSPPKIVHTEEPKPLKSALKKTSTTIPPSESELINISAESVKKLEKLDFSEDILKTPETPTVTSPTPPTTPASQIQEASKPEAVKSVNDTDECIKVSLESVTDLPKSESVEPKAETPMSEVYSKETLKSTEFEIVKPEYIKETPIVDADVKESLNTSDQINSVKAIADNNANASSNLIKHEQKLPTSEVPKLEELKQELSESTESTETPPKSQSSVDNSPPLVSDEPPVAPKRTNKGSSNVSKNIQSSE